MSYQSINNSEIQEGATLDVALLSKIKNNFDAHASDLVTKQDLINRSVGLGTVRSSTLTVAQFTSEHPGQWMLMNGQSCAGTAYATLTGNATVPNALTDGAFIRQAKAGRNLGSFEAEATKAPNTPFTGTAASAGGHSHSVTGSAASGGAHTHQEQAFHGAGGSGLGPSLYGNRTGAAFGDLYTQSGGAHTHSVSGTSDTAAAHTHSVSVTGGDTETRPKNLAVNFFIKVGY